MPASKQSLSVLRLDIAGLSDGRSDHQDRLLADEIVPGIRRCAAPMKPAYFAFLGQSVLAAFEDPVAAAKSALSMRDYFRNTNWSNLGMSRPLSTRIGLHCGPVSLGSAPGHGDVLIEGPTTRTAQTIAGDGPAGQVRGSAAFAIALQEAVRAEADDTLRVERVDAVAGGPESSVFWIAWSQERAAASVPAPPPAPSSPEPATPPLPARDRTSRAKPEAARPVPAVSRTDDAPRVSPPPAPSEGLKMGVVMLAMGGFLILLLLALTWIYTNVQLGFGIVVTAVILVGMLFVVSVAMLTGRLGERATVRLFSKLMDHLPGRK